MLTMWRHSFISWTTNVGVDNFAKKRTVTPYKKPFTSQVNVNDHKNKTDKSGKGSGRNSGVIM